MKQSKVARYVRNGLLLAMVLAVLGACADGLVDTPQENEGTSIGYKKGEPVKVRINLGSGGASRSMAADTVPWFSDTYEVVFRKDFAAGDLEDDPTTIGLDESTMHTGYYRGTGTKLTGYVSVEVPIAEDYDVLLLGGRGTTLLAAGYITGQDILADTANVVTITLKTLPLQWDTTAGNVFAPSPSPDPTATTNDFRFEYPSGTSATINAEKRRIEIPNGGPGNIFALKLNTAKFDPLITANAVSGKLTIKSYRANLWPRFEDGDKFVAPVLLTIGDLNLPPDTAVFGTASSGTIPGLDIDAVLEFELTYHAYGTPDSHGTAWIIRNGLVRGEDSTAELDNGGTPTGKGVGNGSYFVVKIGAGTPVGKEKALIPTP
jgi:hypothetical protein